MLDIKLIRSNPELVKENIKKKFQDQKLPLVDEVLELDAQFRASKGRGDELRQQRNTISKEIGKLMSQGKKEEAQEVKKQVQAIAGELEEMERKEAEMTAEIRKRMLVIPNLIDDSVPIGKLLTRHCHIQAVVVFPRQDRDVPDLEHIVKDDARHTAQPRLVLQDGNRYFRDLHNLFSYHTFELSASSISHHGSRPRFLWL